MPKQLTNAIVKAFEEGRKQGIREGERSASRFVIENDFRVIYCGFASVLFDGGFSDDMIIDVINKVQEFWSANAERDLQELMDEVADKTGVDLLNGKKLAEPKEE